MNPMDLFRPKHQGQDDYYKDRSMAGSTEHEMLALLQNKDRYGFEFIKRLDEASLLVVGEGSIYPLLSRLENNGLLWAYVMACPDRPDRKRKYYRITSVGENYLTEWNRQWREFKVAVDSLVEGSEKESPDGSS